MFSCEYYEIFKNTCFEEHLRAAASDTFTCNDYCPWATEAVASVGGDVL